MTVNERIPDYDLEDMVVVTAPGQLRALADPLRGTILELLLERAATVTELARAVGRPKSTVAYHVNLLVDEGLLRVVRTRRVRAIEERYYGRVARTLYIGVLTRAEDKQVVAAINGIAQAAVESAPAHAADDVRCTLVHARIPIGEVRNFWAQVQELARQFAQIPRSGDQVYGFVAGLYPTDAPTLPDAVSRAGRLKTGWRRPPSRETLLSMSSIRWDAEIAEVYDETYAAMFEPSVLGPMADVLAELAGGGAALEFAIGTGRVALPLSARGIPVRGIELSPAMAERLSAKPGVTTYR